MKYAIENYFHFHYEQVHDNLIDDYDYLLINEINNLRPILCQAWETILSDAHSFVIDGYDSNCNFHINFGWLGTDNGFYLNELTIKLLQKIEELTLYTIEQQKRIELQEIRIKQLEQNIK